MGQLKIDYSAIPPLDTTTPTQIPNEAKKQSMLWPMLAATAGTAGDIIETQRGLGLGGREVNPFYPQNRAGNAAAMIGAHLANLYLINKLGKNHPNLGKLLGYGTGAVGALSTIHNERAIRQMQKDRE